MPEIAQCDENTESLDDSLTSGGLFTRRIVAMRRIAGTTMLRIAGTKKLRFDAQAIEVISQRFAERTALRRRFRSLIAEIQVLFDSTFREAQVFQRSIVCLATRPTTIKLV